MNLRINTPDVSSELVEGEVIAVHLKSGYYYSLHGSAGYIWKKIESGVKLEKIKKDLAKIFSLNEESTSKDVDAFLKELTSESLITEKKEKYTEKEKNELSKIEIEALIKDGYEKPHLVRYDDMKDLLLLDPIHDVSEEGWPHKK